MARELPPLDPEWRPVTPRGELALRVAVAIRSHGWTEAECAQLLGVSIDVVRRLRSRAARIYVAVLTPERHRYCRVCGKELARDARRDAKVCLNPSTCRVRELRRTQRASA